MEGKTCCVTGHRDLPQKEINHVKTALRREIDSAVADGFTRFMSGFADGVDQYFAEIVLEKKKTNPALELIAVIPYQKRLDSLMAKGRTYVLPSSTHEVILVPDNGNMQTKELEDMVKEVNATQVAPEDLLSDKVQYYDRAAKTLGRKQEKGLLERLSENKAQVQEREAKAPKERQKTKQEPSL